MNKSDYNYHRCCTAITVITLILFFLTISGCAVLTDSQVKAINTFAKRTTEYDVLPGAVIKQYAELNRIRHSFEASNATSGENSWKRIISAADSIDKYEKLSQQADDALNVLDKYAAMLQLLSSDEYAKSLDASAERLGQSLDKAIEYYNARNNTSINSAGSAAAAVVRAGGGLYIRYQQAKALQKFVEEADPLVKEMTRAVERLMNKLTPLKSESNIDENKVAYALQQLKEEYTEGFEKVQRYDVKATTLAINANIDADKLVELIQKTHAATIAYRQDHSQLFKDTRSKANLENVFEYGRAVYTEIKAGLNLKKKLEK